MLQAANLLLRFLLELAALFAAGYWGFATLPPPVLNWLAGIGLPVALAALWGIFRIPDDGGRPVIQVGGQLRLAIEALVFGVAIAGLYHAGRPVVASLLLALVVIHYAIGHRRTRDLFLGRR